jgi:hypothetical protein
MLRALYGVPGIYPLSTLTPQTFASGLQPSIGEKEASLLLRLDDDILVFKDFTTVLEMRREHRQTILAQLREIYDGRFDKAWGTGHEVHWEGRLGFIAGVTPVIDRHQGAMSILGERFLLFRLRLPDRRKVARQALRGTGTESQMRKALSGAMAAFLAARGTRAPRLEEDAVEHLVVVADFVTRARSGVERDRYRRDLDYAPAPEVPTRFVKVLAALAKGIALAYDSPAVTRRELCIVTRVALDCLPIVRRRVLSALVSVPPDESHERAAITEAAGLSQTATRRTLEDLHALGVVARKPRKGGKPDRWRLNTRWDELVRQLLTDDIEGRDTTPLDKAGTPPRG